MGKILEIFTEVMIFCDVMEVVPKMYGPIKSTH